MIEVVCAIIAREGKVLVCRRPQDKREGGKWEFPGGKLEEGELFEEALKREMWEELRVQVSVGRACQPVVRGGLCLRGYLCDMSGELELREHTEHRWVGRTEGDALDWAAMDVPVWEEVCYLATIE